MKHMDYGYSQQMNDVLGRFSEETNKKTKLFEDIVKKAAFFALFTLLLQAVEPIRQLDWDILNKAEIFALLLSVLSSVIATYAFLSIERLKRVNEELEYYKHINEVHILQGGEFASDTVKEEIYRSILDIDKSNSTKLSEKEIEKALKSLEAYFKEIDSK